MATKRRDCERRFRERYSAPTVDAMLAVEREAIGANVGANGYTTLAQADMLAKRLLLTPGSNLLDIGSGRGWPGLYLAAQSGCRAVLADMPEPALATALNRAQKQRLSGRVSVLRADGTRLPFLGRAFDAITHTDTL